MDHRLENTSSPKADSMTFTALASPVLVSVASETLLYIKG